MNHLQRNEIYDYITINKRKFLNSPTKEIAFSKLINFINFEFEISIKNVWNYLTEFWDKKCQNPNCSNERKIVGHWPRRESNLSSDIYEFCSSECNYKSISNRQQGDNNTSHRMTIESKNEMKSKLSKIVKNKIKNGTFTPNVTNSWAGSKCSLIINNKVQKYRSSWEAFFQIVNPTFEYEKIRIPYKFEGIDHNYIVDFIDKQNKNIYEIKPDSQYKTKINQIKYKAAIKWCKQNDYKLIQIGNQWFKDNFNLYLTLLIGQPDQELILKRLNQFRNEN